MEKDQKQKNTQTQTKHKNTGIICLGGVFFGIAILYITFNTNDEKYKISYVLHFVYTLLKILVLIVLSIIILYVLYTVISDIIEKYKLKSYKHGIKLDINGHTMVAVQYGIEKEKTIIILTGLLSASPALHYKPLADALSDKYRVVIIEPFGYGLSDTLDPKVKGNERTVKNIVTEYHAAVKQLGIDKYYLLGHSIGGSYTLYWANEYKDEVLGCIVFDATTFYREDLISETIKAINNIAKINKLGIQRIISVFDSKKIFLPLYSKYNYTKEEITMFRILALQKSFNKSVLNESTLMMDNLLFLKDMKFPKCIPVLDYVCSVNVEAISNYKESHIALGTECNSYELIELEGNHLFYFLENYDVVSKKIDSFIK